MGDSAQLIATLAAGLWAGASSYISVVEHPAKLQVGIEFATEYFRPMARRAAPTMIVMALIAAVAGFVAWAVGEGLIWLIGGALMAAMLPMTAIFIVPTNRQLISVKASQSRDEAAVLLTRWGRLHAIRSLLGIVSFTLFVWALSQG